jgi:hypothetical protein
MIPITLYTIIFSRLCSRRCLFLAKVENHLFHGHNLSREHSVIGNWIAEIRDAEIQKDRMRFRRNLERIGEVAAYEISKKLPMPQPPCKHRWAQPYCDMCWRSNRCWLPFYGRACRCTKGC